MEENSFIRVKFKGQGGNNNGKDLSVVWTWACGGQRGQPFEPAYPPSLAGQSSDRKDRRGRRNDVQGSCLFEVPEVRVRQKSGKGVTKMRGLTVPHFSYFKQGA